jgi:hypothetical protein
MSIDLLLTPVRPVLVGPLLPRISSVLRDLLGLTFDPTLTLTELDGGVARSVLRDELGTPANSPLLIITIAGEREAATMTGDADHITVSAGGVRTALELALTAAVAIVLAREFAAEVWDDQKVFGDQTPTTPDTLVASLKVRGPNDDYREAASRIRWGPAGGSPPRRGVTVH